MSFSADLARERGRHARGVGIKRQDCPYEEDDDLAFVWREGWDSTDREITAERRKQPTRHNWYLSFAWLAGGAFAQQVLYTADKPGTRAFLFVINLLCALTAGQLFPTRNKP